MLLSQSNLRLINRDCDSQHAINDEQAYQARPLGLSNSVISRICWLNAPLVAITHTPELRETVLAERNRLLSITAIDLTTDQNTDKNIARTEAHPAQNQLIEHAFLCLAHSIDQLSKHQTPPLKDRIALRTAMIQAHLARPPFWGISRRQDSSIILKLLCLQFGYPASGPVSVLRETIFIHQNELDVEKSVLAIVVDDSHFTGIIPTELCNKNQRWQLRSILFTYHQHCAVQIRYPDHSWYVDDKRVTRNNPFGQRGTPRLIFYDWEHQMLGHGQSEERDRNQINGPSMIN